MKIKKLVVGLLMIICLGTFIIGCVEKEKIKENIKIEATAEKDKNKESEKAFNEFTKVLEAKNVLQTKEFILDNMENVTEDIADKMVVEYELILNSNFEDLVHKYNSHPYFNAVNETMDQQHNLNLEEIKDEKIKEEVMDLLASGYTFKMIEGSYYLTIDYAMIHDTFSKYLSENLKPYYELRKKDLEHPTFVEEYVSVDFEELKNRVVTLEKVIRDNKGFANREDIKDLMKWHIQALLTVGYFNESVNYETGEVGKSIKNIYEDLKASNLEISKHAAEEMDRLLSEFQYVLKKDDEEAYKKVNSLKFRIVDEVGQKIEEHYLVKQNELDQMKSDADENIIKFPSEEIDFSDVSYQVSESARDPKLEEAITQVLRYNKETDGSIRYYYNRIDLNEDKKPETFVYLLGTYVSGSGGSTALIFEDDEDEYKLISKITLVRNPIIVSHSKTNGFRDLIMYVSGGGIKPFYSQIKFDGSKYPSNPSVQPQVKSGTIVKGKAIIADDTLKNLGIEME